MGFAREISRHCFAATFTTVHIQSNFGWLVYRSLGVAHGACAQCSVKYLTAVICFGGTGLHVGGLEDLTCGSMVRKPDFAWSSKL